MHVAARARLVLARRPWVYWATVALLAGGAALGVSSRLAAVDAARDSWGDTRTVLVADGPLEPGDLVTARSIELPMAALPHSSLTELRGDQTRMRQRAADGEVLTELDVTARPGPAAGADPDTVVVAVADPLARGVAVGLAVQVTADGLVLAPAGTVVSVVDDVVFVAVSRHDGPMVAAASQQGIASLIYLP